MLQVRFGSFGGLTVLRAVRGATAGKVLKLRFFVADRLQVLRILRQGDGRPARRLPEMWNTNNAPVGNILRGVRLYPADKLPSVRFGNRSELEVLR